MIMVTRFFLVKMQSSLKSSFSYYIIAKKRNNKLVYCMSMKVYIFFC